MRHLAALLLGSILGVQPVHAAASGPELTPSVGLRGGQTLDSDSAGESSYEADGAESFGLGVDFPVRPDARVEVFVDRQKLSFEGDSALPGAGRFDLMVDYLQVGGVYEPPRPGVRPFVGVAAGLTRFDSDGARLSDSVGVSASIAGGLKIPIARRLALRLELRGYATLSDTSVFAACGAGCTSGFASDGWYQLAGRVGLAIGL